ALVAADPDASHDARLTAACLRVEAAVEILTSPRPGTVPAAPAPAHRTPAAHPALTHLHDLERALAELVSPLSHAPYAASANA
ncbi:FUSC family protein, partial [Streptomyces sp. SID10692]|nr:FUSC family protein [Streptomyces sp. SID10692]